MSKYPLVITDEHLEIHSSIPDEVIERDIEDTKKEIIDLEQEIEGYKLISKAQGATSNGKMATFLMGAKAIGLQERRDFVVFLQAILTRRKQNPS